MLNKELSELKIILIMGGNSAEREVSLRSGKAIVKALESYGIKVVAVDGVEQLLEFNLKKYDAVFNILHGESGENGNLAGMLCALEVKYTGTKTKGAVLSWDKNIAKIIVATKGLKTPVSQHISNQSQLVIDSNGPWIIKPNQEGSSVGLFYTDESSELSSLVSNSLQNTKSILVEKYIKGRECTVSILKNKALPVIRIEPAVDLYDYNAKYSDKNTQYHHPSGFSEETEAGLMKDALTAYKALSLSGWARVDFIVDDQENRWFLEANTTPGMTETSLVPKAAKAAGIEFNELVLEILSTAFTYEQDNV